MRVAMLPKVPVRCDGSRDAAAPVSFPSVTPRSVPTRLLTCREPAIDLVARWCRARASGILVRLLGGFDPFLQGSDRELVVPDRARRKELWRALGRPGAVAADGEIVGTWRPRASGRRLTAWAPWDPATESAVEEQVEMLGRHRSRSAARRA